MSLNPNSNQKRIAFGYERTANNRIIKHDGQAAAVQLIYQYYSEGKSLSEVKETLESTPVVDINISHSHSTGGIKHQKIHFVKGDERK